MNHCWRRNLLSSSPHAATLVIYNDKFDSKLLHLSKTERKKEMKLCEWLIDSLSMEPWKESTVCFIFFGSVLFACS